jgi:hypothetical protein
MKKEKFNPAKNLLSQSVANFNLQKKLKKVFLGVPCSEVVRCEFAQALAGATHYNAQKMIHSPSCFVTSSVLHDSRNKIVHTMLTDPVGKECEWLIFIDSDMIFPNDAIERLISHPPHVKIVGANYCSRIEPYRPTASALEGPAYTREDSTGLEEIETMGMGLVAIHRDVLESMESPYFDWITGPLTFLGEDVFFFNRARQNGFSVYLDHDISKEVYHVGSVRLSNTLAVNSAAAALKQSANAT